MLHAVPSVLRREHVTYRTEVVQTSVTSHSSNATSSFRKLSIGFSTVRISSGRRKQHHVNSVQIGLNRVEQPAAFDKIYAAVDT